MDDFEARRPTLEAELGEPVTIDGLSSSVRIFQRKKGHRYSTDDLLTAWYALEKSPPFTRYLDLGTGIGGVGLLVVSESPGATLTCIEAQAISYRLLQENVRANRLEARVETLHGDLRELSAARRFQLITGSPPYFDVSAGVVPADSQKAHARFELRGHVGDYASAAARHLEPDGMFVFCFPWAQKARAVRLVEAEGFSITSERDVVPRASLPPLFSVFACRLGTDLPCVVEPPFVVRNEAGRHTDEMHQLRARFGWPPQL